MNDRRPPIVTDIDRQWAIEQQPPGWDAAVAARWEALPARQRPDAPLTWATHVAEQIERFEGYFGHDRKPPAEWSGLWRRSWWPKSDPSVLHPREVPGNPHPFLKRGHPQWLEALAVATEKEREVAMRFGVIVFRRDDPRAKVMEPAE